MTELESNTIEITQSKLDRAERSLRTKLIDFSYRPEIQAQIGEAFYIWKNDPEIVNEYLDEEDIDDLTFAKFLDWFIYDFKLFDSEKRIIEQFYEEEGEDLTDIEKSLLDGWLDNLYSFFEVEEVAQHQGYRIRDIFTGEIFQIKDSASAEQVVPSEIIAARPLKVGKNSYFSSVISIYPQAFKPLILDFFQREFDEYKKTFGKKSTPKEYLKDWGFLIGNYVEDIVQNPQFLSPEGDEFVFASAIYTIKDYKKFLKNLQSIKSLQELEGGTDELRLFSWAREDKNRILGTIEVEKDKLIIRCYSQDSLKAAKGLLENKLSTLITHQEDSVKQFGLFMDKQAGVREKRSKLPSGVMNKSELDTVLDEYYDTWIDKPLEALEWKTPRQALETKRGRDNLNFVLRDLQSFYERAREHGEPYYDVKKLRNKLKLK
ncbi:MAG TPA: hypothetical protein VHT73_05515 [Thermodesulfobacteriota bacterium]|nr:hypothetical protein [Thermodesulfobacteriota bacterium]